MSFDDLTDRDKVRIIRNNADFIVAIEYYNTIASLYAFRNTFMEIQTHPETNQVIKTRTLTVQDLDLYLSRIHLCL